MSEFSAPSIPLEREMADSIETTPNPACHYQDVFRLSEEAVTGKNVLDIGAGASDFTDWVNRSGGTGFATDVRYGIFPLGNVTDAMAFRFGGRLRATQEILTRFSDSYVSSEGRYVNTFTGAMPFKSNSFDLVVSHLLINYHLLHDEAIDIDGALGIYEELLRVTKPGGKIKIAPSPGVRGDAIPKMIDLIDYWCDLEEALEARNAPSLTDEEVELRSEAMLYATLISLYRDGKIEVPRFYQPLEDIDEFTVEIVKKETRLWPK